ncbi:MAG TPA: oxygen-independent coproporphyrinogen III oxidase [Woeseiaceae bacterium]|nr:oxygen-independent coproporphyrinogen III oxidase [Woeseiaceae bacterium]
MQQTVTFDADLLRRYDVSGPRYTSYPTALKFHPGFGAPEYSRAVARSNRKGKPLSLYVHVPFCASPCFYCGCTRIITRDPLKAKRYLDRLYREIELQADLFESGRIVGQLHLGGGTPTFLNADDIAILLSRLRRAFAIDKAAEVSIEIDPRTVDGDSMTRLAQIGFNRISLGVQDFDRRVQEAVNRVQSVEETTAVIDSARHAGITSINLDLIYGLPFQGVEGFSRTIDTVIGLRPERLAVYSYAHLPRMFKAQHRIRKETLPDAATKLALLRTAIDRLTAAGYAYIGMDHFALENDELVVAQGNGTLQRNFQGYSTRADCDMIGLGMSAIGKIADTYSQNAKDLDAYYAAVDEGRLAIDRGVILSADDRLRRQIIQRIMCQGEFEFADFQFADCAHFLGYFSTAAAQLEQLENDGMVEIGQDRLTVTARGRLLLRTVAMAFDAYASRPGKTGLQYSRVL